MPRISQPMQAMMSWCQWNVWRYHTGNQKRRKWKTNRQYNDKKKKGHKRL